MRSWGAWHSPSCVTANSLGLKLSRDETQNRTGRKVPPTSVDLQGGIGGGLPGTPRSGLFRGHRVISQAE